MSHGGGEGGGDRWLVSYADFITLLMVLFVVLYSMGQVDVEKYKQLADSLRAAFTLGGGPVKVVDSQISQGGGRNPDGVPNPIVVPGIPDKPPASSAYLRFSTPSRDKVVLVTIKPSILNWSNCFAINSISSALKSGATLSTSGT